MFGYIQPFKPNLRVCEFDAYKAAYCGLCRALGKEYGALLRLALSYDGTFVALLGLALSPDPVCVEKGRCTCNPFKRCNFLCKGEASFSYAAAVTVLLTYHKAKDDIRDSSFLRGLKSRLVLPFISAAKKKAAKKFPGLAEEIARQMQLQAGVESEMDAGLDRCAEPSANMLSFILAELSQEEAERRVLQELGYHMGRWVYFIDAADDLEKDLKQKQFNPLINRFSLNKELTPQKRREIFDYMNGTLNASVARITGAFRLLGCRRLEPIIENIMAQGLGDAQRRILFGEENKNGGSV